MEGGVFTLRKETGEADRRLRSKRHEEEAKRIPSGRFLSGCKGSFFAKRHRIEQIVLNGLTVYSFEDIITQEKELRYIR